MELTFRTSESTAKLDAALVLVQSEVEVAEKDKENPHFRSRYADLASIWKACRPALVKHGVNVTQWPAHGDDNRLHLVTRVAHAGEWMLCHFSMPVTKQDPQGYGSAITYAKRYCLASVIGVVSDEDDDGNAASQTRNQSTGQRHAPARPSAPPPASSDGLECPQCAGPMWDNRTDPLSAINGGKRPDLKCKDKGCDAAIWLGSVRDDLVRAMEQATQAEVLTDAERQRAAQVAENYKEDPAALFKALEYVRGKLLPAVV